MTIDEAIKHAKEVAERIQKDANKQKGLNHGYYVWQSVNADKYRQIAEWLEELKEYKENKHRSLRYMYEKGYNKGIDETCNYICCEWSLDRINTCEDFDKISQQLKVGGIDYD